MTDLIQSQFLTMVVMFYCGMTVAIVYDVFSLFIERFFNKTRIGQVVIRLTGYIVIGFIIGEFTMFCQNGKITFYEMLFLTIGLLLWRKLFCGKINPR